MFETSKLRALARRVAPNNPHAILAIDIFCDFIDDVERQRQPEQVTAATAVPPSDVSPISPPPADEPEPQDSGAAS